MKFINTFCLLALLTCTGIKAQVFIIERGSDTFAFQNFTDAVAALQDDDKLFVPPGGHAGDHTINKSVIIYGAGYNNGAESSRLDGLITLAADGIIITGIRFNNLMMNAISNLYMTRCLVSGYTVFQGTGNGNFISECEFVGNFGYSTSPRPVYCTASKCIFRHPYLYAQSSIFYNCIFLGLGTGNSLNVDNGNFNNNIFMTTNHIAAPGMSGVTNSTFDSNLWVGNAPSSPENNHNTINANNIMDELYANVFTNPTAGDFSLKSECSGKGAGTDGRDVGIFGTEIPFKESRMPAVPAFTLKSVAPETDATGKLNVKFVIEAQER